MKDSSLSSNFKFLLTETKDLTYTFFCAKGFSWLVHNSYGFLHRLVQISYNLCVQKKFHHLSRVFLSTAAAYYYLKGCTSFFFRSGYLPIYDEFLFGMTGRNRDFRQCGGSSTKVPKSRHFANER